MSEPISEVFGLNDILPTYGAWDQEDVTGKQLQYYSELRQDWVAVDYMRRDVEGIAINAVVSTGITYIGVNKVWFDDLQFRWVAPD